MFSPDLAAATLLTSPEDITVMVTDRVPEEVELDGCRGISRYSVSQQIDPHAVRPDMEERAQAAISRSPRFVGLRSNSPQPRV